MNSSTSCNPAILQKQNEETAVKKIEEANQKLQTIKKQRDGWLLKSYSEVNYLVAQGLFSKYFSMISRRKNRT